MNTNSATFRAHVRAHLLSSIYDYTGPATDDDKARHMWAKFCAEYNYPDNRRRVSNTHERVRDWLSGLPLNIAYTNGEILALSESWHGAPHDDKLAERVVLNWFNLLAMHMLHLWKSAGIDPHNPDLQGCRTHYESN